mgnify:FL=1
MKHKLITFLILTFIVSCGGGGGGGGSDAVETAVTDAATKQAEEEAASAAAAAAVREARIKKEKAEQEEKERAEQEKVVWDAKKQTYKTKNPLVLEKAAQLIKLGHTDFAVFSLFRSGLTDEAAAQFETTKLQLEAIKLGLTDDEQAIRSIAIEARDKIARNGCQSFFYYIGATNNLAWNLRERSLPLKQYLDFDGLSLIHT